MVEPIEPHEGDQSAFSQVQSTIQPPPVEIVEKKTKPLTKMLIGFGIVLVVVLILGLVFGNQNRSSQAPKTAVEATPTPATAQLSEMEKQLESNRTVIQQADPEQVVLPPPQVDMDVEF
jgi:uncharacterized protein HemX